MVRGFNSGVRLADKDVAGSKMVAAAFLLALMSLASAVGCGGCSRAARAGAYPLPPDDGWQPQKESKTVDLDVYLDASGSMKSFLAEPTPAQKNYFTTVLNRVSEILTEPWDNSIAYWRFGAGAPQQIKGEGLRSFLDPARFNDNFTHIEAAIDHQGHPPADSGRKASHVKIIITDLMQDKDGAGVLAALLDREYLNKESRAVGVLGVRSAFHGPADIPGSSKDSADTMPFYFIIAGEAPDVRFVMKHLVSDLPIAPQDRFEVVFTQRMVNHLTMPVHMTSTSGRFVPDNQLVPGSLNRFPVLTNVRDTLKLNLTGSPDYIDSPSHINLTTTAQVKAVAFRNGKSAEDTKGQAAVTVDPKGPVEIKAEINRSSLDPGTMYQFQIDIVGGWEQPLSDTDAWNLESSTDLVNHMFPADAHGIRQGRTRSLRHFLNTMRLKMRQYQTPLARYYIYVMTT
jgi:hypothetical protein